jgi:hypothetical protein
VLLISLDYLWVRWWRIPTQKTSALRALPLVSARFRCARF